MATYAEAARIMAGDKPPPDWLPDLLSLYGEVLKSARQSELTRLNRREMRNLLSDVYNATGIIKAVLTDPRTLAILLRHHPNSDRIWDVWGGLSDIAAAAKRAGNEIAATSGPDRARTAAEVKPRVICAMVVQIVVEHLTGRCPTGRAKREQAAAEALWRASGGPDFKFSPKSQTTLISWENAFKGTTNADPGFLIALKAMLQNRKRVAIPPVTAVDSNSWKLDESRT